MIPSSNLRVTEPTPLAFRQTLSLFPTGVTVVAACNLQTGEPHGMTANAFMSVSLEPALTIVSIRRRAHLHSHVLAGGRYGVSFLGAPLEREARRFAGMPVSSQEPEPEFELHAGAPVLRDAMAWLAAEVVEAHDTGDHTLFVGHVLELDVKHEDQLPLCFFQARFAQIRPIAGEAPVPLELWSQSDAWG